MTDSLASLPDNPDIDACMGVDRHGFRRRLQGLRKRERAGQPHYQGLEKLVRGIDASKQRFAFILIDMTGCEYYLKSES